MPGGLNITITITLPPNTNLAGGAPPPPAPPAGAAGSMPNSYLISTSGGGNGSPMQISITVNGVLPPMSNLTYNIPGYNSKKRLKYCKIAKLQN
jgi:hypothetical protein